MESIIEFKIRMKDRNRMWRSRWKEEIHVSVEKYEGEINI